MQKGQRTSLITLYLAYFADYLSWGVAIAFLAVYITADTTPFSNLFWSPQVSLGVAFAAFPVGEVIGSPILGDLSDWIGRKKVLIWGFWGSIFSMVLSGFSLWIGNFSLFLLTQFLKCHYCVGRGISHPNHVPLFKRKRRYDTRPFDAPRDHAKFSKCPDTSPNIDRSRGKCACHLDGIF